MVTTKCGLIGAIGGDVVAKDVDKCLKRLRGCLRVLRIVQILCVEELV